MKVRHRPLETQAIQVDKTVATNEAIVEMLNTCYLYTGERFSVTFSTLEGMETALCYDWIVAKGDEFYAMSPSEFEHRFEEI
jgi:hypothetical protein